MHISTAFAPSPNVADPSLDSFAAFLEKLAQVDLNDASAPRQAVVPDFAVQSSPVLDEDLDSLSYERALRRKPVTVAAAVSAVAPKQTTALAAERLSARTCFRLTVQERSLVQQRATESQLSVSAYIRSCVLEVETLRAQVKQLVEEVRANGDMPPRMATDETPVIAALPRSAALPSPTQTRPLKPATTREPQPSTLRHTNPRVQAAVEAQRRLASEQNERHGTRKPEAKSGLFRFFFGTRKSA